LVVAVNLIVLAGLLLLLEVGGQTVALLFPSYEVLFLQPDRAVGWKQVPNLEWTWAGSHWYAADFSVRVKTNSMGFRDRERRLEVPANVSRIAVLGDSFIEAVQVPLEQTGTQLLEQRLNATATSKYEVLNFGISNYGVGQYLLVWREYVRQFKPDRIAIFVARLHMWPTLQKYSDGAFPATEPRRLWIRPVFHLAGGVLQFEPARDYDDFRLLQAELERTVFGGGRSRPRHQLITPTYGRTLAARLGVSASAHQESSDTGTDALMMLNLAIIDELRKETSASGSRLALIDASRYFNDEPGISAGLKRYCQSADVDYIPLSEMLLAAVKSGKTTRWKHDGHLNVLGNSILAEALFRWIRNDESRRHAPI